MWLSKTRLSGDKRTTKESETNAPLLARVRGQVCRSLSRCRGFVAASPIGAPNCNVCAERVNFVAEGGDGGCMLVHQRFNVCVESVLCTNVDTEVVDVAAQCFQANFRADTYRHLKRALGGRGDDAGRGAVGRRRNARTIEHGHRLRTTTKSGNQTIQKASALFGKAGLEGVAEQRSYRGTAQLWQLTAYLVLRERAVVRRGRNLSKLEQI